MIYLCTAFDTRMVLIFLSNSALPKIKIIYFFNKIFIANYNQKQILDVNSWAQSPYAFFFHVIKYTKVKQKNLLRFTMTFDGSFNQSFSKTSQRKYNLKV